MANEVGVKKIKEDEIDLIDLLKVIIINKKIIIGVWILVVILGITAGVFIKKTRNFEANRKFGIREVGSETTLNINPISLYEDQNFIDKFFETDLIKSKAKGIKDLNESSKKALIKKIFDVTNTNNEYSLKLSSGNRDELKELEKIYFSKLQEFLKSNYGSILNKDLELQRNNSLTFKKELLKLETQINELVKTAKGEYKIENLKELHPTIFAEKESIAGVYSENYKEQKVIENSIAKLNDLIIYKSTLNSAESKLSIKLVFVISNVLGVFLGIFIVFIREFLKGINWQELKQLSK